MEGGVVVVVALPSVLKEVVLVVDDTVCIWVEITEMVLVLKATEVWDVLFSANRERVVVDTA